MAHRYYETEEHSTAYRQFRPLPPPALIDRVMEYMLEKVEKLHLDIIKSDKEVEATNNDFLKLT